MSALALKGGASLDALRDLLQQRFPGAIALDRPKSGVLPSGIPEVDSLLPGGLPRGAMSLALGSASSGKTGLALTFARQVTGEGGRLAWVHSGTFSAPSAEQAGVALARLLSVRVASLEEAHRVTDFLLRYQAFDLVVLDMMRRGGSGIAWNRLNRLVTGSQESLLVLGSSLPSGSPLRYCASLILSLERSPLSGCTRLLLEKSRYGSQGEERAWKEQSMRGLQLLPEMPGLGQAWHDEVG